MGNIENNNCQSSLYLCNLFPVNNKGIRKSISSNIKNTTNNSFGTNIPISYQSDKSDKESGEFKNNHISRNLDITSIKLNQTQNTNISKYFLINPNLNKIKNKKNNKTTNLNTIKNKANFIGKNNSCSNINNKNKLNIVNLKNKVNLMNRRNSDVQKNEIKNIGFESEMNRSSDEETIINNSITDNSINYKIDSLTKRKERKINQIIIKNLEHIKNMKNKISNIKLQENDELSRIKNNSTEKELDILEGSIITNQSKDSKKYQKNKVKNSKDCDFKYSNNSFNIINNLKKIHSIKESTNTTLKRNNNIRNILISKQFNLFIPQERYFDIAHPLNYILKKRQIKSSLYPLDKDSFNIINYIEDNSQQYSYFKSGLANGFTKYIIGSKKKIIFEGEFENGFPKGYGKYFLTNEGRSYEGLWDKEIKIGIESWKDGTIYMGDFKNNKKHGIGIYRWNDGTIYYGEWKNNNMDGYCYIKYADDRRYEGQMMNGAKNGYGEFTWKPTRKYIGYYLNDLKEGFGVYIWNIKTFQIYVGFWHKGKMDGIGMMINGKSIYYGKYYRGEKTEQFKNSKQLKLKFKSTELKMANNLINNLVNNTNKKTDWNEAKLQLEKCINLMCNDYTEIKSFIKNIFIKTNEILKEK